MAKNKVDACIFCGEVPCVCERTQAAGSKPTRARSNPSTNRGSSVRGRAAYRSDISLEDRQNRSNSTRDGTNSPNIKSWERVSDRSRDSRSELDIAIEALVPILSQSELDMRGLRRTVDTRTQMRAQQWRRRNGK